MLVYAGKGLLKWETARMKSLTNGFTVLTGGEGFRSHRPGSQAAVGDRDGEEEKLQGPASDFWVQLETVNGLNGPSQHDPLT